MSARRLDSSLCRFSVLGLVAQALGAILGLLGDADLAAQHCLLFDEAADLRPRLGEPLDGRAHQALIDLIVGGRIVEELQGQAAAADHVLAL